MIVNIQSPKQQAWFKVKPDTFDIVSIKWNDTGEWYYVNPDFAKELQNNPDLKNQLRMVKLHLAYYSDGEVFLIPITYKRNSLEKLTPASDWDKDVARVVSVAQTIWCIKKDNKKYSTNEKVKDTIPEPKLQENMTINDYITTAFKGKIIGNMDHPIIRQLTGAFIDEESVLVKREYKTVQEFLNGKNTPLADSVMRGGLEYDNKSKIEDPSIINDIILFMFSKRKERGEISKKIGDINRIRYDSKLTADEIINLVKRIESDIYTKHNSYNKTMVKTSLEDKKDEQDFTKNPHYGVAKKIYESGKFIDFCIDTWNKVWYHDEQILKMILMAGANHRLKNVREGLHTFISGNTQIGKTQGGRTALKFIPIDMKVDNTFSKMWIYYAFDDGKLTGKQFLFSDDSKWDEETAAIYRSILTSWDEGCDRGIVMEGKTRNLHIPPRITLISTAVDIMVRKSDEGQDESRYTIVEVYHTKEQERQVKRFLQKPAVNIDKELEIVKIIWSLIPECEVELPWMIDLINIPKRGELDSYIPYDPQNRELLKYMGMLKAKALLSNKRVVDKDDEEFVNSFLTHTRPMIKGNIAGPTDSEKKVIEYAYKNAIKNPISISKVSNDLEIPPATTYTAIRGKEGTFERPTGGILTKYPEFSVTKNDSGIYCISITPRNDSTSPETIESSIKNIIYDGLLKQIKTEDVRGILMKIANDLQCKNSTLPGTTEAPIEEYFEESSAQV